MPPASENKAVLGFRAWKISPKGLHPLSATGTWTRGLNISVCQRGRHASPDPHCHCGFNAWFSIAESLRYSGYLNSQAIHGAVAGAGRTQVHGAKGFRSEQAQILALWLNFTQIEQKEGAKGVVKAVKNIQLLSELYRVPVFLNYQDFSSYVKQFDLKKGNNPFRLPAKLAEELKDEIAHFENNHYQSGKNEIFFNRHGQMHRVGGPALVLSNGIKKWYRNGVLHREDGPAAIDRTSKEWWFQGKLHRVGDPAVVRLGHKEWWENGVRHRGGDFPAIMSKEEGEQWWVNGKRHRENRKPAIIKTDGSKEYWENDNRILSSEALLTITNEGDIEWKIDGVLHRDGDMPAVERMNGDKEWWHFGERHREKGLPAVVIERDNRVFRYEYWEKNNFLRSETKVLPVGDNSKAIETKTRLGLL